MPRDKYIDISKGIGIIFVLLGHLSINMILVNMIYIFHMPLFFYVSGIYMKKKSFFQWLSKNKSLLFYYFAFGLFFSIVSHLKDIELVLNDLVFLLESSPNSIWKINWFGPFWFLISLLLIRLLYNQFVWATSIYVSLFFFFVAYLVNSMFNNLLLDFPLVIGPALMMMLFFNFSKYHLSIMKLYTLKNTIYFLSMFIIFNFAIISFYGGSVEKLVNYQQMKVVYPLILAIIGGYVGIVCVLFLSKIIEEKFLWIGSVLAYFGKHSLLLFAWHSFFYFVGERVIHTFNFSSVFLSNTIKFFLAIVFTVAIIEFINYVKGRFKAFTLFDKVL